MRFTALLHHVSVDRLREAYRAISPNAAKGSTGLHGGTTGWISKRTFAICTPGSREGRTGRPLGGRGASPMQIRLCARQVLAVALDPKAAEHPQPLRVANLPGAMPSGACEGDRSPSPVRPFAIWGTRVSFSADWSNVPEPLGVWAGLLLARGSGAWEGVGAGPNGQLHEIGAADC